MALACLTGIAISELLYRSPDFRDAMGRIAGRGHLLVLEQGKGIYESDLESEGVAAASDLIVARNLDRAAAKETIESRQIERELGLLQAQFTGEEAFGEALRASGLSVPSLRERIVAQLRGRQWLEKQMAASPVSEQECRQFYDAHRDRFLAPVRFRAAHLFLAAPAGTAPEVVEEKESAIAEWPSLLARGEQFSQLAPELSEDEATKTRAGDLGFFSEARMPPDFFAEIQKLRAGGTSQPFRTRLGFHIAQVQEIRGARLLHFEEARAEIALALENRARRANMERLKVQLDRAIHLPREF